MFEVRQALLTYAQLMSILSMLEVKWPSVLQGLFKAVSWITHIAPKVCCLDCPCCSDAVLSAASCSIDLQLNRLWCAVHVHLVEHRHGLWYLTCVEVELRIQAHPVAHSA